MLLISCSIRCSCCYFFLFKQKTAYEMRISDWSSDVCSSDLGICAGSGAMVALAADFRFGTPGTRTAFLFTRVGLAGADMGACTLLPRMIGQGRASELLYTGRAMTADEGLGWGFFNSLHASDAVFDRSEEHTYELQSLMRHSYAVFC